MRTKLAKREYELAVLSQGACNLSGLAHDLSRVVSLIWEEARDCGEGTDYVNTHPIVKLYTEQMHYLASCTPKNAYVPRNWSEAYAECKRLAESP